MALKGRFEQTHVLIKGIQWIGCMLFFTIIAMVGIMCFSQPYTVETFKWIQFLQTAAMLLLPPLCMAYLWSKQPLQWLQLSHQSSPKGKDVISGVLLMVVAIPAINLLGYINQQMTLPAFLEPLEAWMKMQEENAAMLTEQFLQVHTFGGLIVNLLLIALLPAVAEELTFRGVLQKLFMGNGEKRLIGDEAIRQRKTPHIAIWCSAIIFSAIHLQFYGFVPRMLMGALFGYMLAWTGSLWIPILMHFTNNAIAVLLYFIAYRAQWDVEQIDAIGTKNTLWLGVLSLVVVGIGIYAFRRSITMSNASSRISKGN